MAAAAPREDVVEALKREVEALKQENEAQQREIQALKQENKEHKEFRIHASYYGSPARLQVLHDVWVRVTVLHTLNMFHSDFMGVFFDNFHALVKEEDHEAYVRRMADYIRSMKSQFMFVRIERPLGSKRFVLAYMNCERVFSFVPRYNRMRGRLDDVPALVLEKMETEANKALRRACMGPTTSESSRAMQRAMQKYGEKKAPLCAAIYAQDEESAEALLDGEADPNEVDSNGLNALHMAAEKGCRLPLFHRILGMIHNVNAGDQYGDTALMYAARWNHLDMVVSLMNHPGIDLNVQDRWSNNTALHYAVLYNRPAIVAQLVSDDRVDTSLKTKYNYTPLKWAIRIRHAECAKILREHGAPEE